MGRQIEKAKALERAFRLPTIVGAQKLDFFAVLHAKLSQMTALSYHAQVAGVLQAQKILPLILLFCHTLPCRPLAAVRELGRSRAVTSQKRTMVSDNLKAAGSICNHW